MTPENEDKPRAADGHQIGLNMHRPSNGDYRPAARTCTLLKQVFPLPLARYESKLAGRTTKGKVTTTVHNTRRASSIERD